MKSNCIVILSCLIFGCTTVACLQKPASTLFYNNENNVVFSHFMDSTLNYAHPGCDSLMFMVLFSKDNDDTLVTFCSLPYPNRIAPDPNNPGTIHLTSCLYRGYVVLIYNFSNEMSIDSLICAKPDRLVSKRLAQACATQSQIKSIRGTVRPYLISHGRLVSFSYNEVTDYLVEEPFINNDLFP